MPGYVIHLATAQRFMEACGIGKKIDLPAGDKSWETCENMNRFLLGSIVPDIRKGSRKKKTHFWSDETMKHFQRKPDLEAFLARYGEFLSNPFVFGYYAHLYMDYKFVDGYWRSHFAFFDNCMRATDDFDSVSTVRCTGTPCDSEGFVPRERFFSEAYYYGDYSRMNDYIMQSYHIQAPYFDFDGTVSPDDIHIIDEIGGEDFIPALREMLGFVDAAFSQMQSKHVDESTVQATLKVFDLKAMNALIEQTVRELVRFAISRGIFVE